jgi:hypothetical protein
MAASEPNSGPLPGHDPGPELRRLEPEFDLESALGAIDRAVEEGWMPEDDARALMDDLAGAHDGAEIEDILLREFYEHPHAA